MRVLYFGTYQRAYPRNAQVIAALRSAGVEVEELNVDVWGERENWRAGAGAAIRLVAAEARLLRSRPKGKFDAVVVGYPGHLDLLAARRAARGAPVVFNPLVSLADTLVGDRGRFANGTLTARVLETIDRRALRAADLVVADTAAHAELFRELGRLPHDRVAVCFVGAEERLFKPAPRPREFTHALFVGKLIPLHGVETILAAARLAPEIPFRIVGQGQLEDLLRDRPPKVEWVPWVPYEELPRELHRAGCALGVFAARPKAARVIPNKAYQALACATPLVTADTPAARELLVPGESALLVAPGDAPALAEAVRAIATDGDLRERLSTGGHDAYRANASEDVLGRRWRDLLAGAA